MKRLLLVLMVISMGLSLFAFNDILFREDDMLLANMEDPINDYQPCWATDSLRVIGVGRFPYFGSATSVFVVDTIAYVAMGFNIVILNVKDKTNPIIINYFDLPAEAQDIFVSNNYAYVADYTSGLQIINISNPSSPTLEGSYNTLGYAWGIYVSGNYAYVADGAGGGLQIINISNPSSPALVGNYNTPGDAKDVYVSGSYAYIADWDLGLQIISISDPTTPYLVGTYNTSGYSYGISVLNNYAFIADANKGLQILDISNPYSPIYECNYATIGSEVRDVYIEGNYAYLASGSYCLEVVSIINPSYPTRVGACYTNGGAFGVYVSDSVAYVADNMEGLEIIDVSEPSNPDLQGNFKRPGQAYAITLDNDYAYIANGKYGLQVINISDQTELKEEGSYNTAGIANGICVLGNNAYIADGDYGLEIINISNPSSPALVGNYNTPGYAYDVYVSGSYAYVADYTSGLQIINISNPSSPTLAGSYNTPGGAKDVYVSGNYAYVADDDCGLQIINISNPSSPTLAGSYDTPGLAEDVYVSGNYAYIADVSDFQILDISNPSSPILAGSYNTSGTAGGVYTSGNYAYVADGTFGLQIMNISNPSSTMLVGYYKTPGFATDVEKYNEFIFLTDRSGMYILEFIIDTIYPTAFNLIAPVDTLSINTPTYLWNQSYDDNLSNYKLYVNGALKATVTDTSYTQMTAIADGQYVWYVVSGDSTGNTTESTQRDTFYLDAVLPTAPVLISPSNGTYENILNKLIWRKSTDSYPGISGYKLQIDEDSMFVNPDSIMITDTSYTPVLSEGRYYWRVGAVDNFDNIGNWSTKWTFEYDGSVPSAPLLVYPRNNVEIEDSLICFDWQSVSKQTKATTVSYVVQVDTIKSFSSPVVIDTTLQDSMTLKLVTDRKYYWRVRGYDEANNQGSWSLTDSFELDIKVGVFVKNMEGYNYGDIDVNKTYRWSELYLKNIGDATLNIDSIRYTSGKFSSDTSYTYPLTISANDSFNFKIKSISSDTGNILSRLRLFTSIYGTVKSDTVGLYAHYGVPTSIDSAKAFDGSVHASGVDSDDYIILYFNQTTNGPAINSLNVDNVFDLSNGHSWLDGFSEIDTAYWNTPKTQLMIELSTITSLPTIVVGDTIFPDSSTIIGTLNSFRCHYPVVITGSFYNTTGITEKYLDERKAVDAITELTVTMNQVSYTSLSNENEFSIYDITGKVVHSEINNRAGKHSCNTEHLSSGIYFIRFRDGEKEINRKMVIIR